MLEFGASHAASYLVVTRPSIRPGPFKSLRCPQSAVAPPYNRRSSLPFACCSGCCG
jgi:hypothetical protein